MTPAPLLDALLDRRAGAAALAIALVAALARPRPGRTHDRHGQFMADHDRARAALQRGEILPLDQVLARMRPQIGGELVGIHLEREDGRWLYEFVVIRNGGQLARLHVDARTAQPVSPGPE